MTDIVLLRRSLTEIIKTQHTLQKKPQQAVLLSVSGHYGMKLALVFKFLREASSYSHIPGGCSTYSILMLRLQHECHPAKASGRLQARHPTAQAETVTSNLLLENARFSNNDTLVHSNSNKLS